MHLSERRCIWHVSSFQAMLGPAWEEHDSGLQDRVGCSLFVLNSETGLNQRPKPPQRQYLHCCGPAFDSIPRQIPGRTDKESLPNFRSAGLPGFS